MALCINSMENQTMTIKIIFKNGLSRITPYLNEIHVMEDSNGDEIHIDIEGGLNEFYRDEMSLENIERIEITP